MRQQTCGVYWAGQGDTLGKGTLTSCPFYSLLPPLFFVRSLKPNSDDGMDPSSKMREHSGFGTKLNICVGCEG
jgi:hypothetical protein